MSRINYWRIQIALYGIGALIGLRRFPADMNAYMALPRSVRLGMD